MRLNFAVANIQLSLLSWSAFQADAHKCAFQPQTSKRAVQSKLSFVESNIIQRTFVPRRNVSYKRPLTQCQLKEEDDDENYDEKSLEELYKIAMEEDEEWYNTFVRDILGEENVPIPKEKGSTAKAVGEEPKWRVTEQKEDEDIHPEKNIRVENAADLEKKTNKLDADLDPVPVPVPAPVSSSKESEMPKNEKKEEGTPSIGSPEDDALVQYIDMYDNIQRVPMKILSNLGYKMADVAKLQADVLELIIEDEMEMPEDGLPRRWLVEGRDQREVRILKKRNKNSNSQKDPAQVGDANGDTASLNERGSKRRERKPRSSPRSKRSPDRDRRPREKSRKRRDSYDDEESSSLWMDIPTFKQYLRREADLRLTILGPDWEDWVKGESDWRLNLYKKWLNVVDNGIGDDMFEDISYAPPSERRTATPPRRKRPRREGPNGSLGNNSRPRRARSSDRSRTRRRDDGISLDDRVERGMERDLPQMNKRRRRMPDDFDSEDWEDRRKMRRQPISEGEQRRARRSRRDGADDEQSRNSRSRTDSFVDFEVESRRQPRRRSSSIVEDGEREALRDQTRARRSNYDDDRLESRPRPRKQNNRRQRNFEE